MHRPARVLEATRVGSTAVLRLSVDLGEPKPGQFVMLWVPGVGEIPLSVADYTRGELLLVVAKKGRVTGHIYERVSEGERLFVRGPYGRPFTLPARGSRALLVSGGSGVAPIHFLARRMGEAGVECTAVAGFRTASEVVLAESLSKSCETVVTTDDGSAGVRGLASDVASRVLEERPFGAVYACGPEPLIEAVFKLARRRGLAFEASLERYVRCAVGVCGSCVLERVGARVCRDGPVFPGEVLEKLYLPR